MPSHPAKTTRKKVTGTIFCVALGIYLVAYLLGPSYHTATDEISPPRYVPLSRLLLPDEVLAEVVGSDVRAEPLEMDVARVGLLDRVPILLATGLLLAAAWLLGQLSLRWLATGGITRWSCKSSSASIHGACCSNLTIPAPAGSNP